MQRRRNSFAAFLAITLFGFTALVSNATEKVTINVNPENATSVYAQQLLTQALVGSEQFELEVSNLQQPIKRDLDMLKFNELNIVWHPTNRQLEKELLAVRIPIAKGLLGYQSIIVKQSRLAEFNLNNQRRLLETLSFGAQRGKADQHVYVSAGLSGVYSSNEQTLIHMLEGDRFDYLPTSTFKAQQLILNNPQLKLAIVPDLVMSFVKPIYFFVNRDNPVLAALLQERLEEMVNSGQLDDLLNQQVFAAHTINKLNSEKLVAIELNNPILPEQTPIAVTKYWYQFELNSGNQTLLSSL